MNFLIIGLPNVGKTSIYNLITENNSNIIHKTIGTTRDWHGSTIKQNSNIWIYDSPGTILNKKNKINKNIENIIHSINILIYVIDYNEKNFHNDMELLNIYRKYNKEIILIVNKDDNFKNDKDIKKLGIKKFFYFSCEHKLGVDEFFEYLQNFNVSHSSTKEINYTIAIYGKTNVGKSTLLNKLVGFNRSIVSDKPKTTTDIVTSSYEHKKINYSIKDTAGLIKKKKIDRESLDFYATKRTLSIINRIDVNLFLIDVSQGFDTQSKKIFNLIFQKSNILLFLINKVDLIKKNKIKIISELKKNIQLEFSQSKNIKILPISTYSLKDIKNLKDKIHKLTFDINKTISTSKINDWLNKTVIDKPHSRIRGKEVKFKYATQISQNPLTVKIFSNFSKEIDNHYKRFLLNNFYKNFNIKSKKVKIIFSKTANPFN